MTITYHDIDWKNILLKRYQNYGLNELDVMVLFISDLILKLESETIITCDILSSYMSAKKDDLDISLNKLLKKKYLVLNDQTMRFSLESFKSKLFDDLKKDLYLHSSTEETVQADGSLYEYIEKFIGRTLSPIERDMVTNWLKEGASEEQIKEACQKSLTKSGDISFKRADKIILELERSQSRKAIGTSTVNEDTRKQDKIRDILNYDWTNNFNN